MLSGISGRPPRAGRQAARLSYVQYVVRGKFSGCNIQATPAELQALVDAAEKESPGYYERLIIDDLNDALKTYKP